MDHATVVEPPKVGNARQQLEATCEETTWHFVNNFDCSL
jgi:hypothetical protein